MKFKIQGADKATGAERTFVMDCSSPEEAIERASVEGFLVSDVRRLEQGESVTHPSGLRQLDYHSLSTPRSTKRGNVLATAAVGIIFAGVPIAVGVAVIYYCSHLPCVGFLGVILGGGLILFGILMGAEFAGINVDLGHPPASRRKARPRLNPAMICPHCQSKGTVSTERVKMKKGISGSKATAAVFTGGISMIATGLSRKEELTKAHCSGCGSTWYF